MDLRHALAPLALTLALTSLAGCSDEDGGGGTPRVRILATTDEHSHLLAVGPERDEWPLATAANPGAPKLLGGVARRATVLERERADGVPTVLLSNGDFSQGTLSAVAFTVANFDVMLMRELGYDAIALGNHEFDALPSGLVASIAAAKAAGGAPPFVLTNARFDDGAGATGDDALKAIYGGVGSGKDVVSGVVVEKGGVKVGVVSAVGPSAAFDVQYQAAPLTFSTADLGDSYPAYVVAATASIAGLLQPAIDQVRAQGAQVVVLLFHGGLASTGTNGDVDLLVPLLRGVDLVVAGHTHGTPPDGVERIADLDGREVPIMQPKPYGNEVLRAEFTVGGGRARFDEARSAFLPVDDRIVPTSDAGVRAGLATAIGAVEASLLGPTLRGIVGREIVDNPAVAGDLYFYPLGTTAFDVTGAVLPRETNALNLDTDAMLAVTRALGYTADVALQNAGSIRGDLLAGATGTLAFADVFRMVSLGADPWELSPGYPLVNADLLLAELRAAYEQTLQMSFLNNDYFLGAAGLEVEWNPTRPAWSATDPGGPGWITRFALDDGTTETPLYDVSINPTTGWLVDPTTTYIPVVTTLLVASFADQMGVHLFPQGVTPRVPTTDLESLVVAWPSTAHVKDHQALAAFIYSPLFGLGGVMPDVYDRDAAAGAVPRRICMGTCP